MNKVWWKEGCVYQLYPKSFMDTTGNGVGDIKGVIRKLDYIQSLGVDIIWLNPIYLSPQVDNGYDIADYKQVDPLYGTLEDFDEMLEEIHKRGMKLVMDLVVNHTSDEHQWFQASKQSKDNPYRDYYMWRDGIIDDDGNRKPPNNWTSYFGGSAWTWDETTEQYFLHIFHEKQPDLNWENKAMRREIYDMMKWWFDKGIDGFRMDVINIISKAGDLPDGKVQEGMYVIGMEHYVEGPKFHDYMKEMYREVLCHYDCMTVGECMEVTPEAGLRTVGAGRQELNMVFHFENMGLDADGFKWNIKELSLPAFKQNIIRWYEVVRQGGWTSNFLMNHDQPRALSRYGDDETYRERSAKMLATFNILLPGTPYIYQGEELGMTNTTFNSIDEFNDVDSVNWFHIEKKKGRSDEELLAILNYISRDHSRTPMQWDNSKNAGFTSGKPWLRLNDNFPLINAKSELEKKHSIFNHYQQLLALRKEEDTLIYGEFDMLMEKHEQVMAYRRYDRAAIYTVVCNFSKEIIPVDLVKDLKCFVERHKVIVSNMDRSFNHFEQQRIELAPYEAFVLAEQVQ